MSIYLTQAVGGFHHMEGRDARLATLSGHAGPLVAQPFEGVPDASETLMRTLATGFSRAAGWFLLRLLKEKLEANIPKLAVLFTDGCTREEARAAWDWFFSHSYWGGVATFE